MTGNAPGPERPGGSDPFRSGPSMPRPGLGAVMPAVLSLAWLSLCAGFFLFGNSGQASGGMRGSLTALVAIVLPVAMIWATALTARDTGRIRDEAQQLRAALDAMRQSHVAQMQAAAVRPAAAARDPSGARDEGARGPAFASRRDLAAARPPQPPARQPEPDGDDQPALALIAPPEGPANPVTTEDLIRALNFPEDESDAEGFRALRRALEDRNVAKLIRASQDVLTLLSHDGIFMDDLDPDPARPEIWRRFAQGERGRSISALGGIRDRSSLVLTAGRMRQDTVFRDAAHHFLRQFDRGFSAIEKTASDQEIAELADSRTARAFMLIGRVAGTFD